MTGATMRLAVRHRSDRANTRRLYAGWLTVGLGLGAAARAAGPPSKAAVEIAEQERAFARTCVEKGMRAAFSGYFAPDAIDFEPQPAPAAASVGRNPDASAPFTLDWEPVVADASLAGDLGWDTGPYVIADRSDGKKPPRYGWFFSVWRRQSDGRWKVALDVGTKVPSPSGPLRPAVLAAFPSTPARPSSLRSAPEADRAALLARDRASSEAKAAEDLWLPEARLHRDGEMPAAGIDRIAERAGKRGAFRTSPSGGGVARSGDLGYTYGSYADGSGEKGYYARVWKMTGGGGWKIAVQVERPLPPDPK